MGEKRKKATATMNGSVTAESVKVIAESVGVSDLTDAVLVYIAEEMTFRLRHTVQVVFALNAVSLCLNTRSHERMILAKYV